MSAAPPPPARPALAVLAPLVAAVLAAPLLPAAPGAAAPPPAPPAAVDCPPDPGAALRVRPGAQVPEPAVTDGGADLLEGAADPGRRSAAAVSPPGSVQVPTYVHVVAAGRSRDQGYLSRAEVDRQLDVLERTFSGASGPGAADTPFRFRRVAVTWTVRPGWHDMQPGSTAERQAKTALRRGDDTALNIYIAGLGGGLLGHSRFPARNDLVDPWADGVVVSHRTVPGGGEPFYDAGDTLPHEVGHWMGLHHTFEGGCSEPGDRVADTPRQRTPTDGCPPGKDTCPAPGKDPVHNIMDYSYDRCMYAFTRGQAARMDAVWRGWRAGRQ